MPSPTTTTVAGTAGTILSVESLVPLIDWLAVHYSVTPMPSEATERALALLLLVVGGTVFGGVWYVVRAVIRKWLAAHQIPLPETTAPGGTGQ
jgi:hypothetical protein